MRVAGSYSGTWREVGGRGSHGFCLVPTLRLREASHILFSRHHGRNCHRSTRAGRSSGPCSVTTPVQVTPVDSGHAPDTGQPKGYPWTTVGDSGRESSEAWTLEHLHVIQNTIKRYKAIAKHGSEPLGADSSSTSPGPNTCFWGSEGVESFSFQCSAGHAKVVLTAALVWLARLPAYSTTRL